MQYETGGIKPVAPKDAGGSGDQPQIGGSICHARQPSHLLDGYPRALTDEEIGRLWQLFVEIGRTWRNTVDDSLGQKSSWLEFVRLRASTHPSYIAEYSNAIEVIDELLELYPEDAFARLLQTSEVAPGELDTALAHAKHFVVDEFIKVQIISGGFKHFIEPHPPVEKPDHVINHRAFIAGSRFNRIVPVRPFEAS